MGSMAYSLIWVMQDFAHQPYDKNALRYARPRMPCQPYGTCLTRNRHNESCSLGFEVTREKKV